MRISKFYVISLIFCSSISFAADFRKDLSGLELNIALEFNHFEKVNSILTATQPCETGTLRKLWNRFRGKKNLLEESNSATGITPLMTLAKKGQANLVQTLLNKGVDINAKDKDKNTALHHVLKEIPFLDSHFEIARILIEAGADLKLTNSQGETPFKIAIGHLGNPLFDRMTELLLQKNASTKLPPLSELALKTKSTPSHPLFQKLKSSGVVVNYRGPTFNQLPFINPLVMQNLLPQEAAQLGSVNKQLSVFSSARAAQIAKTSLGAPFSIGKEHACLIGRDKVLRCTGNNMHGQCTIPAALKTPGAILSVSTGENHTCVVTKDNSLQCFGDNTHGEIEPPLPLQQPGSVRAVFTGSNHNCAILTNGLIQCFGLDSQRQCQIPQELQQPWAVRSLSLGSKHTCAQLWDHSLQCFGNIGTRYLGAFEEFKKPKSIRSISSYGRRVSLVRYYGRHSPYYTEVNQDDIGPSNDGKHYDYDIDAMTLWDLNNGYEAQLHANWSMLCHRIPGTIASPSYYISHFQKYYFRGRAERLRQEDSARAIVSGESHTCAILHDGSVDCFGSNADHQCEVPRSLRRPGAALSIAAGPYHTCVTTKEGSVVCFGSVPNNYNLRELTR